MKMSELRHADFASDHWRKLRPFFCHLTPEFIWEKLRTSLVEEIQEELQGTREAQFQYATFFTYPSDDQIRMLHERARGSGLFFSEIREAVGCRAAQALCQLAGAIRLEKDGATLQLFKECFASLWNKFSAYRYSRGLRTFQVRSNLILMLGSNNVFGLVGENDWTAGMLDYLENESDGWVGGRLKERSGHLIRILKNEGPRANADELIQNGTWEIDGDHTQHLAELCRSLRWEQGDPEDDPALPPVAISINRRGNFEPTSDIYLLPMHLMRVKCTGLWERDADFLTEPFDRIALHYLLSLDLRSRIIESMGCDRPFTSRRAASACGVEPYAIKMALGQMIKVGLVEFDKMSGDDWSGDDQEYLCTTQAKALL
jgi:hypothetical protein